MSVAHNITIPEADGMKQPIDRRFLERLKSSTRADHDAIEATAVMRAIFADGFSRSHYRRLLAIMYGFYRPLEEALRQMPPAGIALRPRLKLPQLEADIEALKIDVQALERQPVCRRLPDLTDPVSALGAMYVIEGASMGGAVILKHLRGTLDPLTLRATSFYEGYGKRTGARWRSMQDALLEAQASSPDAEARIVTAAVATFRSMRQWVEGHPLAADVAPAEPEDDTSELADETQRFSTYLSGDFLAELSGN